MKSITSRCSDGAELDFFDTLLKTKLSTFTGMKKALQVRSKNKEIALKIGTDLSARITLMSQYRKIDVKIVFHYPLGPLPWSISDAFDIQRKTN